MSPRERLIAAVDWDDPIICVPNGTAILQVIPGSSYGRGLTLPSLVQQSLAGQLNAQTCPYCGNALAELSAHDNLGFTSTSTFFAALLICHLCGFWRRSFADSLTGAEYTLPLVRSFQPEVHAPALRALSAEVARSPKRLYSLTPRHFELFVATVLKDFLECEVRHVGGTGDGGIDLVALIADTPLLIQVKRREHADRSEGIEVVRSLFASLFAAGHKRGMIVTSANSFTRGAQAWARSPRLIASKFEIDLVDIARLLDMTRSGSGIPSEPMWTKVASILEPLDETQIRDAVTYEVVGETFSAKDRDGAYVFSRSIGTTAPSGQKVTRPRSQ